MNGCDCGLMTLLWILLLSAVEVRSSRDGFLVKMRDGSYMRCVHNNPQGENVMEYASHPAMVLKMEDGSGLLLPIIVRKYHILCLR